MTDITIANQIDQTCTVYDSYEATDADGNHYRTLTSLGSIAANGNALIPLPHELSTLIVFDSNQKPLTRFTAGPSHDSFTISAADIQTMAQADAFVTYIGTNPGSTEATALRGVTSAADIDAYFQAQPSYNLVTTPTYMLARTYQAQDSPAGIPPEDVTYSLRRLVTSMSGLDYPAGMPDIRISHFFFRDDDGVIQFGGTVDLTAGEAFNPLVSEIILKLLDLTGPVNFQIDFDTNIGSDLMATEVRFSRPEIDVPLGGSARFRIVNPTVFLEITPSAGDMLFKLGADFPLTIFGVEINTRLMLVVDKVEIEAGMVITTPGTTLPSPPPITGVHFDSFGLGMGLVFEPPSYALGVQGSFHIGEDGNAISLNDDTFAVILGLEGEVPNPLYLSFYVPSLDLGTVITALTDVTVDVPVPIEFKDLSFRWSENPTESLTLPDGTKAKEGYGFSAYMHLFGLKGYADADLSLDHVAIDAAMAPVNLAGIFKLTGQGSAVSMKFDAQGDPIRNNVIPKTAAERAAIADAVSREIVPAGGPIVHVSSDAAPYVRVSADATLLGVDLAGIDIKVDNTGFQFDLLLPQAAVACHLSTAGSFGGSFAYGPNWTITLPGPLGSIHLQAQVGFSLSLVVSEDADSTDAVFTVNGGFAFMGVPLEFGPVSLDLDITAFHELMTACETFVVDNVTSIFAPVISDPLTWAKGVLDGLISDADTIASGLNDYFQKPLDDAAQVLRDAGVAVEDAAGQLKAGYNAVAGDLSRALTGVFGVQAGQMAGILNGLGYPLGVISTAISDVFNLSAHAISGVLESAGFSAHDISSAFKALGGAFGEVGNTIGHALQSVGHHLNPSHW